MKRLLIRSTAALLAASLATSAGAMVEGRPLLSAPTAIPLPAATPPTTINPATGETGLPTAELQRMAAPDAAALVSAATDGRADPLDSGDDITAFDPPGVTVDAGRLPVSRHPADPPDFMPPKGAVLTLSGGGYRAMLFHVGALKRLNELGMLPNLKRVSSVSGGSIAAAALALAWKRLAFDDKGVAANFDAEVLRPLRLLASATIDVPAVVKGLLFGRITGKNANDRLTAAYDRLLFRGATLQDLPDDPAPMFVFNASSLQHGGFVFFSRRYVWDRRVGQVPSPTTSLAAVVAASSAFPPFLSPAVFQFAADAFKPVDGVDLHTAPFTMNPILSDGGVNDNLGLEAAKDYDPILVSDASAPLPTLFAPKTRWLGLLRRVLQINTTRVTHMTKHELIAALKAGVKSGTYWGIQADPRNFAGPGAYPFSPELAALAAAVPTRLKAMDPIVQELLISWGYAIADASLRKHLDENLPALESLPYALESAADVAAALFPRG